MYAQVCIYLDIMYVTEMLGKYLSKSKIRSLWKTNRHKIDTYRE